jgi:hypothetical protein
MNALAVTIGMDIYFRNNAFNSGTEEGKKTLAHELTHVAQYEEGRIGGNASVKKLEQEAVAEEQYEFTENPYVKLRYRNKTLTLKKAALDSFVEELADSIEAGIQRQKNILSEENYLKLLVEYETWLKGGLNSGFLGA